MKMTERFKIAGSHIAHESFEDEIHLINFTTGLYYTIDKTGMYAWNLIKENRTIEYIAQKMLKHYDVNYALLKEVLFKFITDLRNAGLIVPDTSGGHPALEKEGPSETPANKIKFDTPKIQEFTDIKEILLLDPIHDVNELGWPHKKD